jgi:hypothetical protein
MLVFTIDDLQQATDHLDRLVRDGDIRVLVHRERGQLLKDIPDVVSVDHSAPENASSQPRTMMMSTLQMINFTSHHPKIQRGSPRLQAGEEAPLLDFVQYM